MRLRINIVRSPSTPLREFRPDVPFSTLQQYGFQEMLLNVVEAPEPVLAYFCQYQGLCSVPIAGSIRMEQVARITSEVKKLRIFFTDDTRVSGGGGGGCGLGGSGAMSHLFLCLSILSRPVVTGQTPALAPLTSSELIYTQSCKAM